MRKPFFVSATLAGVLFGLTAQAHSDTVLEKILTGVLADRYGFSTTEISKVRTDSKYSVFDLASIISGSRRMNTTPDRVWRLRQQGLGWGQIAHELRIHPGDFNKMRNAGYFDSDRVWRDVFRQRFGTKHDDYDRMRKSGAQIEDICGAIVIGKAKNKSPRSIYEEYKHSHNWDTVSKKHGVKFTDWKKHSNKPVRASSAKSSTQTKPNFGQGKSQGKATGGSNSKGGKGQGKGGGNGKGGGHGSGH
ncbi:MAG: hypothetical protein KF784_09310 [Fimbriimonadaceae bacterium]|nr:hypothetical protein [Fimbriimonadaceae bacterium]